MPPEFADIPRELLKHGKGRSKDIILVPQPSDSPNDPLNVRFHPSALLLRGHALTRDSGHNGLYLYT